MKLYIAVIFNDFYDSESGFQNMKIGTTEEVCNFVNNYARSFADECGIPDVEHYYGDPIGDIACEQSTYLPIKEDTIYNSHLLVEDSNTNRVYVEVREISCYASIK